MYHIVNKQESNYLAKFYSIKMEFAELIKTPKLEKVILHGPMGQVMEGTLCITSHHLIISSRTDSSQELWVFYYLLLFLKIVIKIFHFVLY